MKEKLRVPQKNKKTSWNQVLQQESHQRNQQRGSQPYKILRNFLIMDKGGNPEKKENDVEGLALGRWHRLYMLRKEGGREPATIKNFVDASIEGFEEYIKNSSEKLITTASNSNGYIQGLPEK